MLLTLIKHDVMPTHYMGTTHCHFIMLDKPIEIDGLQVTMYGQKSSYQGIGDVETFDLNPDESFAYRHYEEQGLQFNLRVIKSAFKTALREEGIELPVTL